MGGLKKVLIAAAVGLAATLVPVGSAQAAGEVAPTFDASKTIVQHPAVSGATTNGEVRVTLVNSGPVAVSFDSITSPVNGSYSGLRIRDAAGNVQASDVLPPGGNLTGFLTGPAGTATWTFNWLDATGSSAWTGSTAVTITIPDAPLTSIALKSVTPDSGTANGTATFTVCSPDKTLPDNGAYIVINNAVTIDVPSPVYPANCVEATAYGISAGTNTAVLWGDYEPANPANNARVVFTIAKTAAPKLSVIQAPSISGSVRVGTTVKVSGGAFSPAATKTTYKWLRNNVAIPGATKSSYKLTVKDYGKTIKVMKIGTTATFADTGSTSIGSMVAAGPSLKATKAPNITGTTTVGKTLTVKNGSWTPRAGKFSYQWQRNGSAIGGATKATYKLSAADKGKKITCKVTAKATGYNNGVSTTKAVGAVR